MNIMKQMGLVLMSVGISGLAIAQNSKSITEGKLMTQTQQAKQFYDFDVKDLVGKSYDLKQLKGKRVLVVNTASECGFTPQFAQLQELYSEYADAGFVVIGFPSNDYGGQEPGSSAEIASFCQKNYGVTFPMMSKVAVKGNEAHPLFSWLTKKSQNGVSDADITWNFSKFLIDEQGNWVASFSPKVEPLDERIVMFAAGQKW